MSKKKENKNEISKDTREAIIDEAVNQYKEGKIKSSLDVENFLDNLLQPLMQKLLDAELENHLEYPKYEHNTEKRNKTNARNGHCKSKKVKTKYGNIEVQTPRDREATFEPVIIEKGQTCLTGFEDKCIALYAKGMSIRDIEKTLEEIYGVDINKEQITTLISAVNKETEKWKTRRLKPIYVFTYADCLYVPIKEDLKSEKRAVYVILGVDAQGYKEILGIWIDGNESASFWSSVFEDLKERGVEDILYMSSDGIAGFKGSLERVYPKAQSQRCVVHLVRNLYGICPKSQAKEIIADFKKIYTSASFKEANVKLDDFKEKWKENKKIIKKVESFMELIEGLFEIPQEIRKCIYTSNAVESVNSALRKVTRGKGSFPSENSVYKVMYLRIKELSEKWAKPIPNWKTIQPQLIELFGKRYTKYLEI